VPVCAPSWSLIWAGPVYDERNAVVKFLADHGWQTTARTVRELYSDNGSGFLDDAMMVIHRRITGGAVMIR
jgi:hypothetical protein